MNDFPIFFQKEGRKISFVLSGDKETNFELFLCKLVYIGLLSLSFERGRMYSKVLLKRIVKFLTGSVMKYGAVFQNSI